MQVSPKTDQYLHKKLPIDADEKVLAVYRHHWFAYASNWIVGGLIVLIVMVLAIVLTSIGGSDSSFEQNRAAILGGSGLFSILVLIGTFIPVYLRSQEQLVLTEEALLQVLQPSLFASKIDQLNLQRIDDVSVRQDFFGTMFGYGHLTIETPGEQDNYEFLMLPSPHDVAREISAAKENYEAALQAGRLHTTLGEPQAPAPTIDPQQYEEFMAFEQQRQAQQAASPVSSQPAGEQASTDASTESEPQQPQNPSAENQ